MIQNVSRLVLRHGAPCDHQFLSLRRVLSIRCHHETALVGNLAGAGRKSALNSATSPLSVTQTQHAVIGRERIPTHYPNRLLNPAQSVQRIKGCVRHELNAVFSLCTLPISSSTMGYLCVSPCTHLTSTHSASSSARDQGLHPARVHHSLAYTPLATYRYAIRPISDRGKVFEGQ